MKWLFCSKEKQLNDPQEKYHSTTTVREEQKPNIEKNRKNILTKDNEGFKVESIDSTYSTPSFKARLTKIYRGRIVTYDINLDSDVIGRDVEEWCENVIGNEYVTLHHEDLHESHHEVKTNVYTCAESISDDFKLSTENEKDVLWKQGLKDEITYTYIIVCT